MNMPTLPTPTSLDDRDAKIKRYLEAALDYMNTGDPAKGAVANMYARWIMETFELAKENV